MSANLHERLKQAGAQHVEEAARLLLEENDFSGAEAHLQCAATVDKVVAATMPKKHPLVVPGIITLLCLILVVLAWSFHPGDNALRLQAHADGVSLSLTRDWEMEMEWQITALNLERAGTLLLSALGEGAYQRLEATGQLTLRRLQLSRDALLAVKQDGDGLHFFVKNAALQGEIEFSQAALKLDDKVEHGIQVPTGMPPEVLRFASEHVEVQGKPVHLRLSGVGERQLFGLFVHGLDFHQEHASGSNQWESSLREAKGEFLETGRSFELQNSDWLLLEDVRSVRFHLAATQEALKIDLTGTTDGVRGGPEGFVRTLTPSWLEYIYHQERLKLLWGALLFLGVWVWKVRGLWR